MKLHWRGKRIGENDFFDVTVPGNIQNDYAIFNNWGDINYSDNCKRYLEIEDDEWIYETKFSVKFENDEKVFFVSKGIDYEYDIILNGEVIFHNEGLYSTVDLDITKKIISENVLSVKIYKPPKRDGAPVSRTQADNCVKPPVAYGWDWHPRVIPSGIWDETYIEVRKDDYISEIDVTYQLNNDFTKADITFDFETKCEFLIQIYSPDNSIVYSGYDKKVTLNAPELWWCNGEGKPSLYTYKISTRNYEKTGKIGFRTIELIMEEIHWNEPDNFPKTRSYPPIKIKLNGRKIFAKGSNFVSPEIFSGTSDFNTYLPLVKLAFEANMNIFRMWGGSGIQKDSFYELCDEYGIMVWQEFPLACNDYKNNEHYLSVLEKEAIAIIKRLKNHCSIVLWCGGNELFNAWSRMTDQSYALRLLNKICYDFDRERPFLPTSPLTGMAHGCYLFKYAGKEVYEIFNNSKFTAYTEFGVPSVAEKEYLKTFIPENEIFFPKENTAWETHHAFNVWGKDSWVCLNILEEYFGKLSSTDDVIKYSNWLQCEGYKAIFEEARRQQPYCSMAINWCFNEPWKTAANNSILSYPNKPKKAYYEIKNSLKNVIPSAKINKFSYKSGELFSAEIWLLNDGNEVISNEEIKVSINIGGNEFNIFDWKIDSVDKKTNLRGHIIQFVLPKVKDIEHFILKLKSKNGENSYKLHYKYKMDSIAPAIPVLNI